MPIIITAKVNGFRRCGIAHSDTATEYPDDHFTKDQLNVLQSEPMLVVSVGDAGTEKKQPDVGAEKQIAALKAEVKRLDAEVERLTKDNAELYENVTKLTEDNADLVNELSALKSPAPGTESSAEQKTDDKPAPKGK